MASSSGTSSTAPAAVGVRDPRTSNDYNETERYLKMLSSFAKDVQDFRTAPNPKSLSDISDKAQKLEMWVQTVHKSLNPELLRVIRNELETYKIVKVAWSNKVQVAWDEKIKGDSFATQKNYVEAIIQYTKALEIDPTESKFYYSRSLALSLLGKSVEALADAEKCVELDPQYVLGYLRKGNCHFTDRDFGRARDTFQQGLMISPHDKHLTEAVQKCMVAKNILLNVTEEDTVNVESGMSQAHSNSVAIASVGHQPAETFTLKLSNIVLAFEVAAVVTDHLGLRLPSLICSFLAVCGLTLHLSHGPISTRKLSVVKFICATIMLGYCLASYIVHVMELNKHGVESFGRQTWPFHASIILASILIND